MYRRLAQRLTLRTAIAFTICLALLPIPSVSLLISGAAQGQRDERKGKPKPGKPEGVWPDLDEVKQQKQIEHEAPLPIPSTIRSQRNAGKPWDGRRVGDPEPRGAERNNDEPQLAKRISERRSKQTLRAHARARMPASPPPQDQFVSNFFNYALGRSPNSDETTYWYDQLRVAYGNGATSLKLAGVELGRTLFRSAEYAARNRDAHGYVYDLYKTYLMREPDAGGWGMWEGLVPTHGREYVRRGFEESGEFATLAANITTSGSPSPNAASLISARVEPRNQPGSGMLSRDTNWSLPLLSLPGRAGLDLGLALSYSSMVWTRSGPYIYFDEDNASISPGFRIGFPAVQRKVFDTQTAKNAYLMLTPAGRRVELRQVGASNIYDAADSSYLRLTEDGALLRVHSTDGTRLTYSEVNGEYRCTEVKDRNGNYLTVNHNGYGQITNITDTLGRVITFNYDFNSNLSSITQSWGAETHIWASFGWTVHTMQSGFGTLGVVGTANNTVLPLLQQVGLPGGDRYEFEYTNAAQVQVIRRIREGAPLAFFYTVYQYESTTTDVPRLSQTRVAAENWTSLNGVPGEVTTNFAVDPDGACRMTAPDGTAYKEYYGTGWQKGLTTLSEVWSGGVKKKWATTAWTQDNTSVSYELNPRVTETNVYDAGGNRRRTTIDYGSYAQWGLPYSVREYAADAVTPIRETFTDYNLSQAYLDRRIIGLVSAVHVTNISSWQQKLVFSYDNSSQLEGLPAAATRHDTAYSTSFTTRGNLTSVARWDVTDINNPAKALTTQMRYNTTGSVVATIDPAGHESNIAYDDSFSDSGNQNTFAYPTRFTDADDFESLVQYNFSFGGKTQTAGPPPAGQTQGAIQTITYDSIGRIEKIKTENNKAYTRYEYGPNFVKSFSTVNNETDEAYAVQVFDGVGRVIGAASNHPGSNGGYRAQMTIYDLMGRAIKTSNPAEATNAWIPDGDDSAGWLYTQQTYDWQGRPLRTTHPDTTYKEAAYSGCGCAGGEVVTLTDEGTFDAGVAKRRQQKIYSDVLGRTVKTEILNWQNGNPYSTTVNTYNARDQLTQVRQYAGPEGSGTYQDTTMTYDGHGRLKTRHVPEQDPGTVTTWDYFSDNTVQKITDARGTSETFAYNNRHLITHITYAAPGGSSIVVPAISSFEYDDAGNRTKMTDGLGTVNFYYDQMSRITSERRHFSELTSHPGGGNYTLTYQYNLADQLTHLALPSQWGGTVSYAYDTAARLIGVTGSGFGAITQFVTGLQYRAWGAVRHAAYGDGATLNVTYNQRLLPTRYELSNMKVAEIPPTIMGSENQYFADGRVKYTQDLQNGNFDRAYEYDHVGRIKEAYSGREARGLPPLSYPDNPFRQSYSYDVWGNLKRPFNKHWSANLPDNPTYTNNRRSDATYDAEGNVLLRDFERREHQYDAGGRQRFFLEQEWGLPEYAYERTTIDVVFDGEGRPGKRFQNRYTEDYEMVSLNEPQTVYYVRSTVLGGAPVIEYMSDAGWSSQNIFVGDQQITYRYSDTGFTQWRHVNPVTGSWLFTVPAGGSAATIRSELDPLGTTVGTADPYISFTTYSDLMGSESLYEERGSPFDPGGGCGTIDGMPISCSELRKRMQAGTVATETSVITMQSLIAPRRDSGPVRRIPVLTTYEDPIIYQGLGVYMISLPKLRRAPVSSGTNNEGDYLDWRAGAVYLPQNTLPVPSDLEDRVKATVNNPKGDCADYIKRLIGEVASNYGKAFADDPITLFKRVQGDAGFQLKRMKYAGVADFQGNSRVIYLKPVTLSGNEDARVVEHTKNGYAVRALNELMHHARNSGVYTDRMLAEAAFSLLSPWGRFGHPLPKSANDVIANSKYFHPFLNQHCRSVTGE